MPPGRFRTMAQRNMIRRDCAFAEKFIAERRLACRRKVVADRSKEMAEVKGCRREGSCGWNFFSPSDPFLKVAIDQSFSRPRKKHICQVGVE
jgi:hypothetical protein